MSFLALKDSISSKLGGLMNNLGFGSKDMPYKQITDFNDLGDSPNENFAKSKGYGFEVIDLTRPNFGTAYDSAVGWKRFLLQINPQSLSQDEEFSIQFFPTPKGITVEHQGSIMKDIQISGVTGVHPRKGSGGVENDGDLFLEKGDSGYKQFHDLRNYIRSYVEAKKDPVNKDLRLVFYNFKDYEYYYVEPTRFSLKRDKSRPMMYEYNIMMKTIQRYSDYTPEGLTFPDSLLNATDKMFDRVTNTIRLGRAIINGALDICMSVDREIRSKILDPLQQVELAIQDYQNGKTKVLSLPRKFMKDLKKQLNDISDKLANKVGVDTTAYNAFNGKSNVFKPAVPRQPTYEEQQLLDAFNKLAAAMSQITFNGDNFAGTVDQTIDTINQYYSDTTIRKSNNSLAVSILESDTVQDLAIRYLGDASRYRELIIFNNLKYPYLAKVASDGVLSYNDKILIPQASTTNEKITGVYKNTDYEITKYLSEIEKSLGVDLKLTAERDIAVTNTNDYDLVAGMDTVVQAIGIRLGVEKGGYKLHVTFGINLSIGEKNLFTSVLLREEILKQLSQDDRLAKGTRVSIRSDGNKIEVDVFAKIKGTGGVPLQLVTQE